MNSQHHILLDSDGNLSLTNEIREVADWNIGEKVFVTYNGRTDKLILKHAPNVADIQADGKVLISQEILEESSFVLGSEFLAIYDETTDLLTLEPISKKCVICNDNDGTIEMSKYSYICEYCSSEVKAK